jgi:ATP/maltotriose-dependent transcriptional regulator MalT
MSPALTCREVQVLELLAAGNRHAEVAARLGITRHTVSTHAKNIYRKLGVNNALAAVNVAHELRLLDRQRVR